MADLGGVYGQEREYENAMANCWHWIGLGLDSWFEVKCKSIDLWSVAGGVDDISTDVTLGRGPKTRLRKVAVASSLGRHKQ